MRLTDLTGKRFGRWTVIGRSTVKSCRTKWVCRCDCGTERAVFATVLIGGRSTSCGCYRVEWARVNGSTVNLRHGEGSNGKESPEYRAWANMKSRCQNENHQSYPDYGARGIRMCERWQSFEAFIEDVGRRPSPKHSLDRYPDKNGDYEPGNVRWATSKEQNRNTRAARMVTADGRTQTLAAWLEEVEVSHATFYRLLRQGRSEAEALGFAH